MLFYFVIAIRSICVSRSYCIGDNNSAIGLEFLLSHVPPCASVLQLSHPALCWVSVDSACLGKQISRGTVAGGDACYSVSFQTDRSEEDNPSSSGLRKVQLLLDRIYGRHFLELRRETSERCRRQLLALEDGLLS